jgi:hypothetical protein
VTATLPPRTDITADAINRLDDDTALPGDEQRAEVFDQQCRQSWDAFTRQQAAIERAAWLATQREICDGCDHCGGES